MGSITANLKVKVYFTLPGISAKQIVTWNCHVDDSTKGRYYMVLDRDLLTYLVLNSKFSDQFIEEDGVHFKRSKAPMVNMGTYEFKYLNTWNITPE